MPTLALAVSVVAVVGILYLSQDEPAQGISAREGISVANGLDALPEDSLVDVVVPTGRHENREDGLHPGVDEDALVAKEVPLKHDVPSPQALVDELELLRTKRESAWAQIMDENSNGAGDVIYLALLEPVPESDRNFSFIRVNRGGQRGYIVISRADYQDYFSITDRIEELSSNPDVQHQMIVNRVNAIGR